jgi:hypothetical protein
MTSARDFSWEDAVFLVLEHDTAKSLYNMGGALASALAVKLRLT